MSTIKMDLKASQKGFLIFIAAVFFYILLVEPILFQSGVLIPLQELEALSVASIQRAVNIDVTVNSYTLIYPKIGLRMIISPLCTGIREIALFLLLVLPLATLPLRRKVLTSLPFIAMILVENVVRISILYPMAKDWGLEAMDVSHDIIWAYGQILFLLTMVGLWFYLFVFRPSKVEKATEGKKQSKTENVKFH